MAIFQATINLVSGKPTHLAIQMEYVFRTLRFKSLVKDKMNQSVKPKKSRTFTEAGYRTSKLTRLKTGQSAGKNSKVSSIFP